MSINTSSVQENISSHYCQEGRNRLPYLCCARSFLAEVSKLGTLEVKGNFTFLSLLGEGLSGSFGLLMQQCGDVCEDICEDMCC